MKASIKDKIQAFLILAAFSLGGNLFAAETLIVYPNLEKPLFSIEVPGNWKLTPAVADDQFFQVAGPAGVEMWFRAKPMTSEKEVQVAVDAATKSGKEWLAESYTNLVFDEAVLGEGEAMAFASLNGLGASKRSGDAVAITVAFIAMPNGALAEFWSIIPKKDLEGKHYAEKVLKSFQAK